ncbi:hypothetical protein ACFP1Z_12490 [Streptomyces gamaensis]|uniref:DUF3761 domain-containing protein n=1 Tax=Streptomyces gamaensis TaxID=1763542 RepID=A0ABW0YWT3_9ACTN
MPIRTEPMRSMLIRTAPRPALRRSLARRLAAPCGFALAATLALTGCTGDDKTPTGSTASPSVTASAVPSPTPTESATPSATPPSPTAEARTSAPTKPAPVPPAPTKAASAQEANDDTAAPPAPKRTHTGTGSSGKAACEIRSNAGNCYQAGEFCRSRDVGASTHDAHGQFITCGSGGGRPRWHY